MDPPDASVSLHHCRILIEEGVFKIVDLKSRNNTFVNGKPARLTVLRHNDIIKCGSYRLIFLEDHPKTVPAEEQRDLPMPDVNLDGSLTLTFPQFLIQFEWQSGRKLPA